MLTIFAYSCCCITVDAETELSDETHCTKHAQRVFIEALRRLTYGTHQFVLYVLLTVVGVNKMSFRIFQRNSVDGEVATGEILEQGSTKCDGVWPTLVRVFRLGAVGSYFDNSEFWIF